MSNEPRCARCGHPRSNHPYRHPFVGPSWDDTIKTQADRIEELEAKLAKALQLLDDIYSDYDVGSCGCELCESHLERHAELKGGKNG